ncbi:MAG: chromosome segregation protein SMC, partial [Oscillospiraceae bacterium]|nr:chromosome segregation protein SMC [Oscillospiraceae bacterium]
MYLKSLELQGFKSFPDKIKLNFDKGMTAVVGPNGSGKSNIGDSVRWVLGEQSTKTLRGNKMEDVIFSGMVGRKPMGFASVTLVIDNSENRLEGYGEEVSVTRKLYRSGDSEYRINGKAVRLKDINELFMDTGLGRDGYSIIGQGRIAEIVGAKSNERREIFEEAAGISKFRYKKTEAERKLEQAQEKMERVQDIFQELENRLEPLRHQAQKAEKYLVLAEQEKKLEVSVWIQHLADLQQKLKVLEEQFIVSQAEYENLERNSTAQEEEIQKCYLVMQEASVKAEEAHAEIRELRTLNAKAQADIAVWKNDIVHHQEAFRLAQQRHEQDEEEQALRQEKLEKACIYAEKIQELFQQTEQALAEAQKSFEASEQALQTEDENFRQTDAVLHQLYLDQNALQFSIRSAEEKSEFLLKDMQDLEEKISITETSLKSAEENYQVAFSEMQNVQNEISTQEQVLNTVRQALQQKRQKKAQAEEQFRQAGFQLREKKQRHRILTDLENNMEGFSGSVKTLMKAVRNRQLKDIFGSVAQLIQVDSQYGIAVETALGASVQHMIVADETAAKAGIHYLKENRAGRATFLPLTTMKGRYLNQQDLQEISKLDGFIAVASDLVTCKERYKQIAENLLGRIIISDTIDHAAEIAKKSGYRYRIVTSDGQVINTGGSFTGGSVQKTGGMLTRRTELNALQEEIQQLALACQKAETFARKAADDCI